MYVIGVSMYVYINMHTIPPFKYLKEVVLPHKELFIY